MSSIRSILEEVSRQSRLGAFAPGYTKLKPRKEDYVDQALKDIEQVVRGKRDRLRGYPNVDALIDEFVKELLK